MLPHTPVCAPTHLGWHTSHTIRTGTYPRAHNLLLPTRELQQNEDEKPASSRQKHLLENKELTGSLKVSKSSNQFSKSDVSQEFQPPQTLHLALKQPTDLHYCKSVLDGPDCFCYILLSPRHFSKIMALPPKHGVCLQPENKHCDPRASETHRNMPQVLCISLFTLLFSK